MSKYEFELNMNSDNSLSILIGMIEKDTKVLEFGSANGRMTRYLKQNLHCMVDIVEIDEEAGVQASKYSRKSCLGKEKGDIENYIWIEDLREERYDYIIFADVLEHLHDPQKVLESVKRLLKDSGSILLSVPNIAHNAIIINLFNNKFDYREIGLLDNTHIHFFSYDSLKNMIARCGYLCEYETATYCKTEETELGARFSEIPIDLRKVIKNRMFGDVYQFIFRVVKKEKCFVKQLMLDKNYDKVCSYLFSCYYKPEGVERFAEEYCQSFYFTPGENCFRVELEDRGKISALRIDPMNCNCIIENFIVRDLKKDNCELKVYESNGFCIGKNGYAFETADPNLLIEVPEDGMVRIEVSFKVVEYESDSVCYFVKQFYENQQVLNELQEKNNAQLLEAEKRIDELKIQGEKEKQALIEKEQFLREQALNELQEKNNAQLLEAQKRIDELKIQGEKEKQVLIEKEQFLREQALNELQEKNSVQLLEAEKRIDELKIQGEKEKQVLIEKEQFLREQALNELQEKSNVQLLAAEKRIDELEIQGEKEKQVFYETEKKRAEKIRELEENLLQYINTLKKEQEKLLNVNDKLLVCNKKLQMLEEEKNVLNLQKINAEQEVEQISTELNIVYSSNSWKLTKGYRIVGSVIKKSKQLLKKGMYSLKTQGIRETFRRTRRWIGHTSTRTKLGKIIKANIPVKEEAGNNIFLNNVIAIEEFHKSIAVHLHLFYIDLLDEFFDYLNHIPFCFDLFISCKEKKDKNKIINKMKGLSYINQIVVCETINRGRDIAPFYVQFGKELCKYDYILHIHSKKSLFTGSEQKEWRKYSLDCLVGSEQSVKKILSLMEGERKIGLFFPETISDMHLIAHDWLGNQQWGKILLNKLGIEFDTGLFNYPVGSFFWVKGEAIQQLFDIKLTYQDFEKEMGQTDGTLAHALERVIAFVVKSKGYYLGICDWNNHVVALDKSYKLYQNYFALTSDAVQYHLSLFDMVTFDIFDTLITRCVLLPDDVFRMMEGKIQEHYHLSLDFLSIRKKAEALAHDIKGEFTTIYDIYEQIPNVSKQITAAMAKELLDMEIETELEVCIPRMDMLKIFNHVKQNHRKIILISDMYLTSEIITRILEKCGYTGYDSILVSCEVGLRKDKGDLWEKFFKKYDKVNTIHVGDNPRSDIQLVGDRRKNTFYIMNPMTGFQLSKNYTYFRPYINTTIENSIMLGLVVNAGLYNSPFSIQSSGEPQIDSTTHSGYIGMGALIYTFVEWLSKKHMAGNEYWFLSREGYLFNEVYRQYLDVSKKENIGNYTYFLTSRRATSVAAIDKVDDIREILQQFYRGKLHNLIYTRLGIELEDTIQEIYIEMPKDLDLVMNIISPYYEIILSEAKKERETYLKYINTIRKSKNKIYVVDVGYSGTIQYYLGKLLKEDISGKYICTAYEKKAEKAGYQMEALYFNTTLEEQDQSKIFKNQLFLEAVLQAPFGQLVKFEKKDDSVVPIFKQENIMPKAIKEFQHGIILYVVKYTELIQAYRTNSESDKKLAETILYQFLNSDWMNEEFRKALFVEDDYCSNGKFSYQKNNTWTIN